jgi:hypothetical protein
VYDCAQDKREERKKRYTDVTPEWFFLLSYPGKHEIKTKSSNNNPEEKLTGLWEEAAAFFYTRNTSSPSIYTYTAYRLSFAYLSNMVDANIRR